MNIPTRLTVLQCTLLSYLGPDWKGTAELIGGVREYFAGVNDNNMRNTLKRPIELGWVEKRRVGNHTEGGPGGYWNEYRLTDAGEQAYELLTAAVGA